MSQCKLFGDRFAGAPILHTDATECFTIHSPLARNQNAQGGCTDGEKYYYQVFLYRDNDSGQEENEVRILKYDIARDEVVQMSRDLRLHHANDITYNSKTKKLILCNNAPHRNRLTVIDPETLEPERTVELAVDVFGISYIASRDAYVVGISFTKSFCLLDSEFRVIEGSHQEPSPLTMHFVNQGICSDEKYVYFAFWDAQNVRENPENFQSAIAVYHLDGGYVGQIYFDVATCEPENISFHEGQLWLLAGSGDGSISCFEITEKE